MRETTAVHEGISSPPPPGPALLHLTPPVPALSLSAPPPQCTFYPSCLEFGIRSSAVSNDVAPETLEISYLGQQSSGPSSPLHDTVQLEPLDPDQSGVTQQDIASSSTPSARIACSETASPAPILPVSSLSFACTVPTDVVVGRNEADRLACGAD
jgi:hypothetical protein